MDVDEDAGGENAITSLEEKLRAENAILASCSNFFRSGDARGGFFSANVATLQPGALSKGEQQHAQALRGGGGAQKVGKQDEHRALPVPTLFAGLKGRNSNKLFLFPVELHALQYPDCDRQIQNTHSEFKFRTPLAEHDNGKLELLFDKLDMKARLGLKKGLISDFGALKARKMQKKMSRKDIEEIGVERIAGDYDQMDAGWVVR